MGGSRNNLMHCALWYNRWKIINVQFLLHPYCITTKHVVVFLCSPTSLLAVQPAVGVGWCYWRPGPSAVHCSPAVSRCQTPAVDSELLPGLPEISKIKFNCEVGIFSCNIYNLFYSFVLLLYLIWFPYFHMHRYFTEFFGVNQILFTSKKFHFSH